MFAYGTLMVPDVIYRVCGYRKVGHPATLVDAKCRKMRGEVYPAIVHCEGHQVEGLVYTNLTAFQIELLDRFEGSRYCREEVVVDCFDNQLTVFSYVLRDDALGDLSEQCWSLEEFMQQSFLSFLNGYQGFQSASMGGEGA